MRSLNKSQTSQNQSSVRIFQVLEEYFRNFQEEIKTQLLTENNILIHNKYERNKIHSR
jgi:hypothetical protein